MALADECSRFFSSLVGAREENGGTFLAFKAVPVIQLPIHQVALYEVNMLVAHAATTAKSS